MTEFIDATLKLLGEDPSGYSVFGLAILAFVFILYTFKDVTKKFLSSVIKAKAPKTSNLISTLKFHNLFISLDYVADKIKYQEFEEKSKTRMFHDFMEFKINTIKTATTKFLDDDTLNTLSRSELLSRIDHLVKEEIVTTYIDRTKLEFIEGGVSIEDANSVVNLFEQWREDSVEAMQFLVLSAFANTEYYTTNYQLVNATLEYFSFAVRMIPRDGIESFKQLNGIFKHIEY